MYAFLDRRLDDLDDGARFLVWAMRRWVSAMGERQCPAATVAPAFATRGMIAALPRFHKMMAILNRDGLETFAFAPLTCPCVSESEAILLGMFREAKFGRPKSFNALLAALVIDDAVAPLFDESSALSAMLAQRSLIPGNEIRDYDARDLTRRSENNSQ